MMSALRHCIEALYMVEVEHPHAAKETAGNMFPAWFDAFKDLDLQHQISKITGTD
jgi:hypothetical protein